jgi:uncharacterized protein YgiM (DUF1202 family)
LTTAELNNLRAGPGQTYEIVGTVPLNTGVDIYARSPDSEWLLIETSDALRAWISVTIFSPTSPGFVLEELPLSPDYPG